MVSDLERAGIAGIGLILLSTLDMERKSEWTDLFLL